MGNTNKNDNSPSGILVNGRCNFKELLVCGTNPTLSANVCDYQSTIQLSEYFIDETSPANWWGINMAATDEVYYDENCEDVQATIDLTALSEGTHYVQLHGKDTVENWGKLDQPANPIVSFIKDTTAPKTEKVLNPADGKIIDCSTTTADEATDANVADKGALTNGCAYVKEGTTITLTAHDFNPDDTENGGYNNNEGEYAGNVVIHYIVWYKNNSEDSWTQLHEGTSETGTATVTLDEDSYHLIEYWSTDGCGYEETHHFELDIVDTQAPTLTKAVETPRISGCGDVKHPSTIEACDYYVTQDTKICLTATDQQPHPVEGVSISCEYTWWGTLDSNPINGVEILLDGEGCFTYKEDSYHELHCTATDALGNSVELYEADIVDTQAPSTTETITGPKYTSDDKTYLDAATRVSLSCTDGEPHPVGGTEIYYRYLLDGIVKQDWIQYEGEFGFPEESQHTLEYYCIDALGNQEQTHSELYYVDHTAPTTSHSYGTPYFPNEASEWITSQTLITVSSVDIDTTKKGCNSGVYDTKYRVTLVDDSNCYETCLAEGTGEWNTYSSPFTVAEDSCHLIEYYSVDNVDKTETVKKECVFVDNKVPVSSKVVGSPQYSNGKELFIKTSTPLEFTCTDSQPHPVGNQNLCFKVSQTGLGDLTSDYCAHYIGTQKGDYCCLSVGSNSFTFNFLEESNHTINYYCEDKLGNKEAVKTEIDNVDNTPPSIIVWNPTLDEAANVERCSQSIVVQVFDLKSGVNESSIHAQLINSEEQVVREVQLTKSNYGTYEGLMDKQLPAGTYNLKIIAKDNLGNEKITEMPEVLKTGLFVEYISPSTCNVDATNGGTCNFTFSICMRGDNNIQFWMNKLGGIITPDMLNATITKGSSSAVVGLKHGEFQSEAGLLPLLTGCEEVNGRKTFNLNLIMDASDVNSIGAGAHDLDYTIKSSLPEECTPEEPIAVCGDGITEGAEECDDGNAVNNDACSDLCLTQQESCADMDGDLICDLTDNCPTVANSAQTDADGDLVGDACDNCPTVANQNQLDTNSNGTGDLCESS